MQIKQLGDVAEYINGRAFKPIEWEKEGLPIIRIQNLTNSNNIVNRTTKSYEEKYFIKNGDLLFAWSASLGAYIWNGGDAWLNQHIFKIIPNADISKKYLYYFLLQVIDELYSKTHGSGMVHIALKPFKSTPIPVPSLDVQKRIVERIESLFAKLDEAKENLQNVLDGFEPRKAAILHKAFTGELTVNWRKQHGVTMDSWEEKRLGEVCKINPSKINTKNLSDDLEVSFFPMASLSEITGEIVAPEIRTLRKVKNGFTNFSEGDVVFAKITPCMENGKSAIIGKLINDIGYGTTEFYVLRCGEELSNKYLHYIVRSKKFRDEAKLNMTGAVGQQRVPKKYMEDYTLNLPTFSEQTEIVRIIDDLLAKEQQAKELAENALAKIDLIKKAILARAFRGELGTNNPADEPAVELLKRVL